ncbi:GerAB/ArcD/ProY family transporter [Lysinibacillus sp. BW-2-10]|uniref:GerAB/ArcD/ProY family transporter n=1 Tax=Lysinibacillus sp. BW-2-10 TaxID=2590030 RepID=UPI001180FBAD|nr:GerAB/ArcD/ProY family transporter [Lysinibacillus sp. BW-2-10]TSI05116.1 GerAB/ArcD/ProY family transporter [Lysinibacillus sp. BW-2-10]
MSRFYYYLILVNMVSNIIASVPVILLYFHKEGAISSMILSVVVGTIIITVYTRFFNNFPGMTLPELLQKTTAKWFYNPFIFLLGILWFIAGMITLITFSFLLIRYLTPETPITQISLVLTISVIFGCLMKTNRVLYTIEIILILTFPLIFYIYLAAYSSKNLRWDFVRDAVLYFNQLPSFYAFSASFFLFLGVANIFIFNRFFTVKQKFGLKQIIFIVVTSTFALSTTYFIPIGFNGFEHIKDFIYPWISTSDSIRMKYFIIERVLFIFLLFYLGIAFLSILIHWHVSIEFFKFVFHLEKIKWKGVKIGIFLPLPFFIGISTYFVKRLDEYQLVRLSGIFYNSLSILFPLMIILFLFIKRRMKYAKNNEQN